MSDCQQPSDANARWRDLATEARHPESFGLDAMSAEEAVALLLAEDRRGLEIVERHRRDIAAASRRVADALAGGGRVVFAGAGTSGRLGVLEAAECPPTFGTDPARIQALIAGGDDAVFRAAEGAEDDAAAGARAVGERGAALAAGDLLIGLSASAVTPYVRAALDAARARGAGTVLLTCASAASLGDPPVDLVIALDTGPEVLAGSTRLKAGSATKAALNAITTAAMVRLGKVYQNLMVDLRPGSAKLRDRAVRIVASAGEVGIEEAARLLAAAGGEVKTAIVMARLGVAPSDARRRLEAAGGHVRAALA